MQRCGLSKSFIPKIEIHGEDVSTHYSVVYLKMRADQKREMELTNLLSVSEKQRQQTGKQLQQSTKLWKLS